MLRSYSRAWCAVYTLMSAIYLTLTPDEGAMPTIRLHSGALSFAHPPLTCGATPCIMLT